MLYSISLSRDSLLFGMSGKFRKRKQRDTRDAYPHSNPQPSPSWESETTSEPSAALFIQAYEADIVRGPRAWAAASSLEASGRAANIDAHNSGLMQWKTAACSESEEEEGKIIWVDRYACLEIAWFIMSICSRCLSAILMK